MTPHCPYHLKFIFSEWLVLNIALPPWPSSKEEFWVSRVQDYRITFLLNGDRVYINNTLNWSAQVTCSCLLLYYKRLSTVDVAKVLCYGWCAGALHKMWHHDVSDIHKMQCEVTPYHLSGVSNFPFYKFITYPGPMAYWIHTCSTYTVGWNNNVHWMLLSNQTFELE